MPGRRDLRVPSAGLEFAEVGRIVRTTAHHGAAVVVAIFLVVVLVWNAATLGYVALPEGGLPADPDAHRWDMFAPSPPRAEVWYVVPGRLESGRRIDAFHRRALGWDWPSDGAYPTFRWLEYLTALRQKPYARYREDFAAYLCRRWNGDHATDLVSVSVYLVRQPTRPDGPDTTRRVELLQHACTRNA